MMESNNNNSSNNSNYNNKKRDRDSFENNNSNSSSDEVKLNSLIFLDVLPFLLYDQTFETLLNLSLLSKSTFNSVQNYVSYKQNEIKFYPNYNQLISYINSGSGNQIETKKDEDYKFKLFKFNTLSTIFLKIEEDDENDLFKEVKKELIKYCGSTLNKVHIMGYCSIFSTKDLDPTLNGFYQIDKLYSFWNPESWPSSTLEEEELCYDDEYYEYEYSFEYLKRINPKKFKFSTSVNDMDMHLDKLNNILNCKSLESIKFGYHNTTDDEFIVNVLSSTSPQIKQFTIRPNSGMTISDCLIKSNFINNKSLNKFIIRRQVDVSGSEDIEDPKPFLNQLIGNTSLSILGLELYQLKENNEIAGHKLLSPLIQIPNIIELHCDLDSALSFLMHCNQNSNIKVLHIKNNQDNCNEKIDDDDIDDHEENMESICKYFSTTFIKQNQSLECIKISACFDLYDKLNEYLQQSTNNNNNNNNNSNLIIKKYGGDES